MEAISSHYTGINAACSSAGLQVQSYAPLSLPNQHDFDKFQAGIRGTAKCSVSRCFMVGLYEVVILHLWSEGQRTVVAIMFLFISTPQCRSDFMCWARRCSPGEQLFFMDLIYPALRSWEDQIMQEPPRINQE